MVVGQLARPVSVERPAAGLHFTKDLSLGHHEETHGSGFDAFAWAVSDALLD